MLGIARNNDVELVRRTLASQRDSTYDKSAESDEARFAPTKFTATIAAVEPGQETQREVALP